MCVIAKRRMFESVNQEIDLIHNGHWKWKSFIFLKKIQTEK